MSKQLPPLKKGPYSGRRGRDEAEKKISIKVPLAPKKAKIRLGGGKKPGWTRLEEMAEKKVLAV